MSKFLFETFVKKPTASSIEDILRNSEPFMLTIENRDSLLVTAITPVEELLEENKTTSALLSEPLPVVEVAAPLLVASAVTSADRINIQQKDSLFWCIYILHYGYNDYVQVGRNYGVRSLEVKKEVGEWLEKNQGKMKQTNYKVTKAAVQEIMSECITCQKDTSMMCLLALLSCFQMNLFLLDSTGRLLLKFIGCVDMTDENPTYLLQKDDRGKYSVMSEALTAEEKLRWTEDCFSLVHYEKPLQTISHYKLDELLVLARKMGVYEEGKKYKKADLYLLVWNACSWK